MLAHLKISHWIPLQIFYSHVYVHLCACTCVGYWDISVVVFKYVIYQPWPMAFGYSIYDMMCFWSLDAYFLDVTSLHIFWMGNLLHARSPWYFMEGQLARFLIPFILHVKKNKSGCLFMSTSTMGIWNNGFMGPCVSGDPFPGMLVWRFS